jgi:crotonobetainyl-CoA:carnitine CoA-transferase CaiB-like acyl-CoA transferase
MPIPTSCLTKPSRQRTVTSSWRWALTVSMRSIARLSAHRTSRQEERFKTNRGRVENRVELIPIAPTLHAWHGRQRIGWRILKRRQCPAAPSILSTRFLPIEQVLARVACKIGFTRDDGVQVPGVANPIVFSETPVAYDKPPPRLGDGTDKVLREQLGLSEEAISALRGKGVIG